MRKLLTFTALFLLCCSSLWAADAGTGNQWRISVLASEMSTGSDQPWSDDAEAGVGIGVAYAPTPQWDVELTVASRSHVSPYTRLFYVVTPEQGTGTPGIVYPVTEFRRYRVIPVDVSATRHFLTDGPIAPYVRAGIRYVGAPGNPTSAPQFISPLQFPNGGFFPVNEGFHFGGDRTSGQVGAGARIRLTPRTAVRAEVNRLIRSDKADFDPLTRYAVGLSWLF
jgi:hypothetical protein